MAPRENKVINGYRPLDIMYTSYWAAGFKDCEHVVVEGFEYICADTGEVLGYAELPYMNQAFRHEYERRMWKPGTTVARAIEQIKAVLRGRVADAEVEKAVKIFAAMKRSRLNYEHAGEAYAYAYLIIALGWQGRSLMRQYARGMPERERTRFMDTVRRYKRLINRALGNTAGRR